MKKILNVKICPQPHFQVAAVMYSNILYLSLEAIRPMRRKQTTLRVFSECWCVLDMVGRCLSLVSRGAPQQPPTWMRCGPGPMLCCVCRCVAPTHSPGPRPQVTQKDYMYSCKPSHRLRIRQRVHSIGNNLIPMTGQNGIKTHLIFLEAYYMISKHFKHSYWVLLKASLLYLVFSS